MNATTTAAFNLLPTDATKAMASRQADKMILGYGGRARAVAADLSRKDSNGSALQRYWSAVHALLCELQPH